MYPQNLQIFIAYRLGEIWINQWQFFCWKGSLFVGFVSDLVHFSYFSNHPIYYDLTIIIEFTL